MSIVNTDTSAAMGLRQRKKARTRQAIQEVALRLYADQGYDQTTVEQIIAAAEVSERTFFRYFRTKADTIAFDILEPVVAHAFVEQPAELAPTAALRAAVRQVYSALSPAQVELQRHRQRLIARVSGVNAITPSKIQTVFDLFTDAAARRTGRPADDPALVAWVGAMAGVVLATYWAWASTETDRDRTDLMDRLDGALGLLDVGIPL